MKVIDLLNKIAKGEDVPNEIYYKGNDYKLVDYGETTKLYQCLSEPYELFNIKTDRLNDEVEIIEDAPKEDKKIEKVNTYVICDNDFNSKGIFSLKATEIIDKTFEEYSHKINEIIDKLNGEDNE